MRFRLYIVLLGLLLATASCSTHKKTVVPTQPVPFEWMTAKVAIDVEGNGKAFENLSGQVRMRRDSLTWLSVTATMGVEALRVKISTDSVWMVNRMDKTYLAEPIDTLATQLGLPLSLPWIQTLLLDNSEGFPPAENQTILLKSFAFGDWSAKIRYNNIKTDEATAFPLKITDKLERIRIKARHEE